jgi:hypothetical protein
MQQITSILESGNPLHFNVFYYPPVPAIIVASIIAIGRTLGVYGDIAAQCTTVTLSFSVATVGLLYLLGSFWGRNHARIAMAFYSVTMIAVIVQGNPQVYSTFFLLLALYCMFVAERQGSIRLLAYAGMWLGLGISSKYSPLFFSGILFVPHLLQKRTGMRATDRESRPGESGATRSLVSRAWAASLWALCIVAFAMLWIGTMRKGVVYVLVRELYELEAHANPFEYHLIWIDRLYVMALITVACIGVIAAIGLMLPRLRGISTWEWARAYLTRNRLWVVPCVAMVSTAVMLIGLSAVFSASSVAAGLVYTAKAMRSGDSGMFPGNQFAVSYIAGFFPENMGLPLFVAGIVGIVYSLAKRDVRAAIIVFTALPAYILLELSRVKINRYALELMPLWCLLAAVWLGDLWRMRSLLWRFAQFSMVIAIVGYSLVYSAAWAEFFSPRNTVQEATHRWLAGNLPPGTPIGMYCDFFLRGSPELLPSASSLAVYRLSDYTENPPYILLPNSIHAIVAQYLKGTQGGYTYTANDWLPSEPPSAEELNVLSRLVREDGYVMVREFKKQPSVLGIPVGSHSLVGRTWMFEHYRGYGVRIYRRVGNVT